MKTVSLGAYIRSLRTHKGLTQRSLAEKLHVTDKAVSKWERGLCLPDICLFEKLADELGISMADLLQEGSDDETPTHLIQIYETSADVRTPLHIMLGCADLIERYRDDRELFTRYLDSIRISGEYLLSVFDRAQTAGELPDLLRNHPAPRSRRSVGYDFGGKRFLVVEDIDVNREIASEILKDTGAEVEFAEDGQVCIDKVSSAPEGFFDLILMDIKMPNMDGLSATRKLRQMGCRIPIVAMTANVGAKDRESALEAGMNAFTEKPVFAEKLFSTIRNCLEQQPSLPDRM